MRFRLTQVVTLAIACLLAVDIQIQAQTAIPAIEADKSCALSSTSHDTTISDPEISVAGVTFSGFLRIPVSDQNEIAASIKERTYRGSLDQVTDAALEIVKRGWQKYGYFRVQADAYATEVATGGGRRIALNVHVDEGPRYILGGITFRNNRAVPNFKALRRLFPIKDGDTFSREKIMTGLEDLRKAYGELGYINFTPVPNTRFDDEDKLIYLDIDEDEGKQFFVDGINILGVDESFRAQMLLDFLLKPGQIYNGRLVELFLKREHGSVLPNCDCNDRPALQLDEAAGLVTITFDLRSCLGGP
jgi:outer membrane protein assembly factor BamA